MFRKNDDVWHPPVAGRCGWGRALKPKMWVGEGTETQTDFGHLKIFYSAVQKTRF